MRIGSTHDIPPFHATVSCFQRAEEVSRVSGPPDAARAPRRRFVVFAGVITEMHTDRLVGRPPTEADVDDIAALWRDERVTATLGGTRDRAVVAQLVSRWQDHWREHGFGPLVWHDASTGAFIGWCGLQWTTVAGERAIELLYGITADRWGEGLTTEAAQEVLRWADDDLELDEVVSFTLTTNIGSQRVMQKSGFTYERDIEHADLPHVLYRRTRAPRDAR